MPPEQGSRCLAFRVEILEITIPTGAHGDAERDNGSWWGIDTGDTHLWKVASILESFTFRLKSVKSSIALKSRL